jgi:hypothetical protein
MNIVTPIPTTVSFVSANVNTEAARRDNTLRETVPATSPLENSAAETGLGSEADRVRVPGQALPLTYERPQLSQGQQSEGQNPLAQDNADDPSAGKENAESRQQEQQEQAEQKKLAELKLRDLEVRSHEKAHASAGGKYSDAPQYEYETGPDGRRYAVGGEVSIDISTEGTPEETIRKMQQVKAAALSPAEPSPQDLRVASEATQKAVAARNEIISDKAQSAEQAFKAFSAEQSGQISPSKTISPTPELGDIVNANDVSVPSRTLDKDPASQSAELKENEQQVSRGPASRDENIIQRVSVIESFYQQISSAKSEGFSQSA